MLQTIDINLYVIISIRILYVYKIAEVLRILQDVYIIQFCHGIHNFLFLFDKNIFLRFMYKIKTRRRRIIFYHFGFFSNGKSDKKHVYSYFIYLSIKTKVNRDWKQYYAALLR